MQNYLDKERHYENVYSTKQKAVNEGKVWLEKLLREQYEDWFEDEVPNLTHEQLFKLKAVYEFSITEYNPEKIDKLDDINNLPIIENYNLYCTEFNC